MASHFAGGFARGLAGATRDLPGQLLRLRFFKKDQELDKELLDLRQKEFKLKETKSQLDIKLLERKLQQDPQGALKLFGRMFGLEPSQTQQPADRSSFQEFGASVGAPEGQIQTETEVPGQGFVPDQLVAPQQQTQRQGGLPSQFDFEPSLRIGPEGGTSLSLTGKRRQPQSKIGKILTDKQAFVNQFGANSPQVKAIDEVIASEGGGGRVKLSDERGIRQEFTKASGDFVKIRDSFARIQATATDPSPAGDLSLMFNYMKMLDPGSVVRESEFAQIAATGSFGQRLQAGAAQFIEGVRLTPVQRKDFLTQAGNILSTQIKTQDELETEFRRIAEVSGIDPRKVIVDFQGRRRGQSLKTSQTPKKRFSDVGR